LSANKPPDKPHPPHHAHAFVIRIWWETGLTRLDGRPLWRGQVHHAATGRSLVFQALGDLLCFIQEQAGTLDEDESNGTLD